METTEDQGPQERTEITCNINESGVCALHKVEIERRKSVHNATNRSIKAIEESIAGLDTIVKNLVKNFYIFIGTTAFISTIIIASFIYTRDTGEASLQRDNLLSSNQSALAKQVAALALNVARSEGMQSTLITEMREFTKELRETTKNTPYN